MIKVSCRICSWFPFTQSDSVSADLFIYFSLSVCPFSHTSENYYHRLSTQSFQTHSIHFISFHFNSFQLRMLVGICFDCIASLLFVRMHSIKSINTVSFCFQTFYLKGATAQCNVSKNIIIIFPLLLQFVYLMCVSLLFRLKMVNWRKVNDTKWDVVHSNNSSSTNTNNRLLPITKFYVRFANCLYDVMIVNVLFDLFGFFPIWTRKTPKPKVIKTVQYVCFVPVHCTHVWFGWAKPIDPIKTHILKNSIFWCSHSQAQKLILPCYHDSFFSNWARQKYGKKIQSL